MASKQRRCYSSNTQHRGRAIMRPIISSDIMGNRNVEVVPVGAWVEPADDDYQPDALKAARIEEEKIRQMQNEKENRLRKFQQQTRHRVNKTNLLKRQQQIQEAEQAFEIERKVVQQSYSTGGLPRKDTCMVRQDLDLAIRKRLLEKYGEDVSTWEKDHVPALHSHTEEIPTARSVVDADLPVSYTTHQKQRNDTEGDDRVNADIERNTDKDLIPESELQDGDRNNNHKDAESTEGETKVQFTDQHSSEQHRQKKKKRPWSPRRPKSAQMAAILLRDSESDVLARQRRHQAAIARKIFMDRERETVRENIRRQQHRKKIDMLKKEKEIYRQELEEIAHKNLSPADSVSGESAEDLKLQEQMEALQVQEIASKQKNALRKMREMKRYLNALRHTLLEKVTRRGVQLPSLCACGDTVWDTHPDTCANNCFFYKNPRAYARALQSLLSSAEVM
ncbi:unnamed protein product [Candidula unifasciata]|uniref:Coiled-coil domain-containing protein 15 n=1 Tax=Candidula unifasciata TaxID=100452 RepID=A0A8S4A7C8_9EUPU|nr:unnamed protein product [Candidula unifasciata]